MDSNKKTYIVREAAKKNPPLMAGPIRGGGGGVKAEPLRKKNFF